MYHERVGVANRSKGSESDETARKCALPNPANGHRADHRHAQCFVGALSSRVCAARPVRQPPKLAGLFHAGGLCR